MEEERRALILSAAEARAVMLSNADSLRRAKERRQQRRQAYAHVFNQIAEAAKRGDNSLCIGGPLAIGNHLGIYLQRLGYKVDYEKGLVFISWQ